MLPEKINQAFVNAKSKTDEKTTLPIGKYKTRIKECKIFESKKKGWADIEN